MTSPENLNKELDFCIKSFWHWAKSEVISRKHHLPHNLGQMENDAIHNLKNNPRTIIKEEDERRTITLMEKLDYI